MSCFFFFSSRRRHTRCALVTGVQTCALPILVAVGKAWIDLDAVLAIRLVAETEVPRQRLQQLAHVRGIEEVRRAAAAVQLAYRPVAVEQRLDQLDLAVPSFKVTVGFATVAGDHPVTGAVETGAHSERLVPVQ